MNEDKKVVRFINQGEINPLAFSTFGINVKPNSSNPIGFFGTGLKYAVAILLREGCNVTVQAGTTTIKFALKKQDFRGANFDFCTMQVGDDQPRELPFTTELGKGWELWMAYRELYCNCMDEGGCVFSAYLYGEPPSSEGSTIITVDSPAFLEIHKKKDEIILGTRAFIETPVLEIHKGISNYLYYKSIRVMDISTSLFTYNIVGTLTLTEDRTVKYTSSAKGDIMRMILAYVIEVEVLRTILLAPKDTFEADLDFTDTILHPSQAFLNTVGELMKEQFTAINPTAVTLYKKHQHAKERFTRLPATAVQVKMLNKAVAFCKKLGYEVDKYPIHMVESLGDDTIALAYEKEIYISGRVLHQGTKQLAATLIEEFIHLRYGYGDCTRALQTFLFDQIVSLGEELSGEPL